MFWAFVLGLLLILWLFKLNKEYYVLAFFSKRVKTIDGTPLEKILPVPKGLTPFGNTFDLLRLSDVQMFQHSRQRAAEMGKSYLEYVLGTAFYNIITPEEAEIVMNDPNLITKGIAYGFLSTFLRDGLLISTGKKWHARRKMLTPAFHFNILEQFEEIFKNESQKFVQSLKTTSKTVDISLSELIPKFTLNSICETALGVQLDERLDGDKYRASFNMIEECFIKRLSNPFYMNDRIFNLFLGYKYEQHLSVVHEFSSGIIEKRRELYEEELQSRKNEDANEAPDKSDLDFVFKKKRYAMLDTLLRAEQEGLIDHLGICEEVDTFMFEGFDTTSMGLIFSLMNLSLYPELQERCYQEVLDTIDADLSQLNISQLNKLKYLECFIKETLRLYPSVPAIGRVAVRETKLANNLVLPANTQIAIHIFDIHRDPKHFPKPNDFDPERFVPENSLGRHPFAYTPFSGGQRNCIGQKFAMLEMKTLLVYMLSNFKLLPLVDPKEFQFDSGIIIRAKNDIKVKLVQRSKG